MLNQLYSILGHFTGFLGDWGMAMGAEGLFGQKIPWRVLFGGIRLLV
jgi:hypothetical protein